MARVPRPADFGVCGGGGLAMWVTRLGTFSRFGHAAIVETVNVGGTVTVIEAHPAGCRRRVVAPADFVWSDVDLTPEQRETVVSAAAGTLGLPYDWWSIAGFIPRHWWSKFRGRSPDHPDSKMICSELVCWSYRQAGIDLAPGVAAGDVSPGDLDAFLDNRRRG